MNGVYLTNLVSTTTSCRAYCSDQQDC